MAAVQRTPTPVDIRSRRAFIESMEEELKRVQDHLDRRQWKHRNGSTSALDPPVKKHANVADSRQWYTLARTNPATNRRVNKKEKEAEADFVRVSSAQDNVMRASSTRKDSCSSSSSNNSKSPTPEPTTDMIRVKSPALALTGGSAMQQQLDDFSQLSTSSSSSSSGHQQQTRGGLLLPRSIMHHPGLYYSSSLPSCSSSSPKSIPPTFDETPLLVKEMPFDLMQSRIQQMPSPNAMNSDDEDNEEIDEENETGKEVMPSAFGDLYVEEDTQRSHKLSQEDEEDDDNEEEEDDSRSSHSVDDLMQHITPPLAAASLNHKEEDDEGIGKSSLTILESSKVMDDHGSSAYEFQRYQRMQALKEEKARSEMLQIIDELKEQLREKDNEMILLQERMHVEVKVREERIKKLMRQNARSEKEKWDLLKKSREAAERSVQIKTKFDLNENQLRSTVLELDRVNNELSSVKAANKSLRLMVSDLKNKVHTVDNTTQTDHSSTSGSSSETLLLSDAETQTAASEGDSSIVGDGTRVPDYEDWEDMLSVSSSQLGDSRDMTPINTPKIERGKGRRSMKRLLNRLRRTGSAGTGKHHSTSSLSKASAAEIATSLDNLQLSQSSLTTPLNLSRSSGSMSVTSNRFSSVSLQEPPDPSRILEDFKSMPFNQWNTRALVAWMEVVVGMPHYISNVRQHVTSGHAMLALSNSDLEKKLGIPNPLHRRRLRLAIEEQRSSSHSLPNYPHMSEIDHNWVAYTWAVECGLPHISAPLYNGMVNGKVLNSLSKDDLKKYLKIQKKAELLSFLSGVELLRMHDFDRDAIKSHRQSSKNPLYWTNTDVCEWLRSTDLEQYANNVTASGVHGALLFLERGNFTSENLATIIQIPPKSAYRKQLATHLAKLFSTEEITSLGEEEILEEQIPPVSSRRDSLSPTGDGSPHPLRRLTMSGTSSGAIIDGTNGMSYASSNPDISEAEDTAFNRHSRERTSLRESMLRSVNPPPMQRVARPLSQRPVSQVCSTTTV